MKLSQTGTIPKNILSVFKLESPPPHPLFKATALCGDPLGRLWHLKECDASMCVCVCVRENFLYAAQIAGERAESFLHMLVAASAFKDWAPTHQTQPARRNEIPIIFN